jgi:hypothetical protein
MNKGLAGIILIVAGMMTLCVRHLSAAYMAAHHPLNNISRIFNSVLDNTGRGLWYLGIAALLGGVVLLVMGLRSGRDADRAGGTV